MKIRMKGNSVRLRLSKTDLIILEQDQAVTDTIHFGTASLIYNLKPSSEHKSLHADFENNTITIYIPRDFSADWNGNDIISTEAHQEINEDESLFLLVEKDFQCLDKTTEDQSDFFINPNKTCQ